MPKDEVKEANDFKIYFEIHGAEFNKTEVKKMVTEALTELFQDSEDGEGKAKNVKVARLKEEG